MSERTDRLSNGREGGKKKKTQPVLAAERKATKYKSNSQITASGLFYNSRRRRNSLALSVTADSRGTKVMRQIQYQPVADLLSCTSGCFSASRSQQLPWRAVVPHRRRHAVAPVTEMVLVFTRIDIYSADSG